MYLMSNYIMNPATVHDYVKVAHLTLITVVLKDICLPQYGYLINMADVGTCMCLVSTIYMVH